MTPSQVFLALDKIDNFEGYFGGILLNAPQLGLNLMEVMGFVRETTEGKGPLHCVISRVYMTDMTHHC